MGREHEDLVLVTGALRAASSFNCVVDWLSPTKVRRTRILGERGMLVADTLTADLTFYENGVVGSEWSASQSMRGVSEGDMTRYALSRREPLLAELEAFVDLVARRRRSAAIVTLEEGVGDRRDRRGGARERGARARPSRSAPPAPALMRAVVVALGKIGLPLAAQIARAGHEVVGCDIDERVVEQVNAGARAVPGRGRARARRWRRSSPPAGCARRPTPRQRSPRRRTSCSPCRR